MQNGSLWICIQDGQWFDTKTDENSTGPAKGEILTECGLIVGEFLVFEEYPGLDSNGEPYGFHVDFFRKLQDPVEVNIESLVSELQTV